jgi:hypothetical protein
MVFKSIDQQMLKIDLIDSRLQMELCPMQLLQGEIILEL